MPPVDTVENFALWLLMGCLTILFTMVAFFIGKSFTDITKKFSDHESNFDKINKKIAEAHVRISNKASGEEIGKIYESHKRDLQRFKELELTPLSEKLEAYRQEIHQDMQAIETKTTKAISDLKIEINQQLSLIIELLRDKK